MSADDGSGITAFEGEFLKKKLDKAKAEEAQRAETKFELKAMIRNYRQVGSDGAAYAKFIKISETIDEL